ncbi:MAG: DVU0150 family protein [Terriglobales bacterium]
MSLVAILLLPVRLLAAEPSNTVVIVTDTRKLHGWEAWWGNLYNESHILFAVVTVVIIPVCGVTLGLLADLVMSRLGIDLRSRKLAEH